MSKVKLIAKIKAKPEFLEEIKAGLSGLVAPTRKETGCIQYDLHQDQKDPTTFIFLEEWESQEHLTAHSAAPHIAAFGAVSKGKIDSRNLYFLKAI